jgi:xanthine dehydrogenase accessory factor
MMTRSLTERADELRAHGEPFVTATVVRVERPTSAQTGNVALVRRDGTIEGFVGGICAQHSVRLYSLKVIESGKPVLLRILPDASDGAGEVEAAAIAGEGGEVDLALSGHEIASEDGTVTVRNPCLSGGALELFLEPSLPMPRVLVVGESPIVGALKTIGPEIGLDVLATVDHEDGKLTPRPGDLALIVAAHGSGELPALLAGLKAEIPYIGLVASPKRGAAVLGDLRAEGVSEEQVARIDSPAGLNIGARTAAEIALSILAEVVIVRRRSGPDHAAAHATETAPVDTESPPIMTDPICGMTVVVMPGTPSVRVGDETVYFCCEGCKVTFERQQSAA